MPIQLDKLEFDLSFLVNHKLWILSVFLVSTDEKEVHVCCYTKASAAKFAFELTTEVGLLIVKEFHFFSVRQSVFHIDKFTRKHVQIFHFGKSLDMQKRIEFVNQL